MKRAGMMGIAIWQWWGSGGLRRCSRGTHAGGASPVHGAYRYSCGAVRAPAGPAVSEVIIASHGEMVKIDM